jgi:hypothetical protein
MITTPAAVPSLAGAGAGHTCRTRGEYETVLRAEHQPPHIGVQAVCPDDQAERPGRRELEVRLASSQAPRSRSAELANQDRTVAAARAITG